MTRTQAISATEPRARDLRLAGPNPPLWVSAFLLAIVIGAVYHHAPAVSFIFDDVIGIEKNSSVYSLWPLIGSSGHRGPLNPEADLPSSGRPLVNLSLALNYALGGGNPAGYHVFNLAVHFVTALLLLVVVWRTLMLPRFAGRFESSAGWLSLAVALVWAVHPLQTEAVVYVTQRTELLMAMFYVGTLYCSLRYWECEGFGGQRAAWLAAAFVSCGAGMASKEVMVSAPVMVLLYERTFVAGSLGRAIRRSWPLYLALAATWLLLAALNIGGPRGASAGFRLGTPLLPWWLTQAKMLLIYLKLAVWPAPLLIHYQLPYLKTFGDAWMYVVPVALAGIATLVLLWRNEPLGWVGCFVFALLAPTSIVPVPTEMGAERRMYLPLAAFVVLLVLGLYRLAKFVLTRSVAELAAGSLSKRPVVVAIVPVVVIGLLFGFLSMRRISDYDDLPSMWREVLRYQPDNYLAHLDLGLLLASSGKLTEAIESLHRAAELKPDNSVALSNLALALKKTGQPAEAVETLKAALAIDPDYVAALNNMGMALADLGRYEEAVENLQHAARVLPQDAEARSNLGSVYQRAGRLPEAAKEFRAAIALEPENAILHNSLAATLTQMGQSQEAIAECREALRLRPDYCDAHHNLGTALLHANRLPESVAELRAALAIKPDDPMVLNTLGAVLLQADLVSDAKEQFDRALQIRPKYAVARNNLGQVLARMGDVSHAIEQFRLAAEQDDRFSGAQINWALALSAQGKFSESIEHFDKAIELGADSPELRNNLGDAYRKSGDTKQAIEQYEIAVRLNPSYMQGYANLAQTLALVDRSQEALTIADKAMEIAQKTGQQEALEQFEEWLKHYRMELRRAAESAPPAPAPPKAK